MTELAYACTPQQLSALALGDLRLTLVCRLDSSDALDGLPARVTELVAALELLRTELVAGPGETLQRILPCADVRVELDGQRRSIRAGALDVRSWIGDDEAPRLALSLPCTLCDPTTLLSLAEALLTHDPLPADVLQYADYAEWRRELVVPGLADELGHGPLLARATRAGPFSPLRAALVVPEALDRRCAATARELDVPSDALWLAAWLRLQSGAMDSPTAPATMHVCGSGRVHPAVEALIGPARSECPLAVGAPLPGDFAVLARAARTMLLRAEDEADRMGPVVHADDPEAGNWAFLPRPRVAASTLARRGVTIERLDRTLGPHHVALALGPPELGLPIAELLADGRAFTADELVAVGRRVVELLAEVLDALDTVEPTSSAAAEPAEQPLPSPGLVHALVEAGGRIDPNATALDDGSTRLTHAGLHARVARLAAGLRGRGLARGQHVGLLLRSGLARVVASLAVWRAGGACVQLEPTDPPARRRMLIERARVVWTVVDSPPDDEGAPRPPTYLTLAELEHGASGTDRALTLDPADTAWIAFTSGSSGTPRGVVVSHAAAHNYLSWMRTLLCSSDVVLELATPSFDAWYRNTMAALAAGACVVTPETRGPGRPGALRAELARHGVTAITAIVPSLLRQVADGRGHDLVRLVASSGEPLLPTDVARVRSSFPRAELLNLYGPTECTMTTTASQVPAWVSPRRPLSLGRAIPGGEVLVLALDDPSRIVAAGVVGEIAIGGRGLADAYLDEPRATAERFVPHPLEPGRRVYRTGDMGRQLFDGSLEFLGRADDQLEVRGVRIEPAEVEAALLEVESVRAAAVVGVEAVAGEISLVAHVVLRADGPQPDPATLRAALRERLPAAMVPSIIRLHPELPRTRTGKVDRGRLRALGVDDGRWHAPRHASELERELAELWRDVLGQRLPDRDDDFFALGGHSLAAIRLVSAIRTRLGRRIDLASVFETPRLSAQAALLQRAPRDIDPTPGASERRPLAPTSTQRQLWLRHHLRAPDEAPVVAWALSLSGELDVAVLRQTLRKIVEAQPMLRASFASTPDGLALRMHERAHLSLEQLELTGLGEPTRSARFAVAAQAALTSGFELDRAPLARALLVTLAPDEHRLIFVAHHLAVDAASFAVLFRLLTRGYAALRAGQAWQPPPTPELAEMLELAERHAEPETLAAELEFWRAHLDADHHLALPQRPVVGPPSFRGASVSASLPATTSIGLTALVARCGVTRLNALLAVFAVALHRVGGSDPVVIGLPLSTRRDARVSESIAPFVDLLPRRVDLDGAPTWAELVTRVHAESVAVLGHARLSFEQLVRGLGVGGDALASPLFRATLVYDPEPIAEHREADLRWVPSEPPIASVSYDLSLFVSEPVGGSDGSDEVLARVALRFRTQLLTDEAAAALLHDFVELLAHAVHDPSARWSELPRPGAGPCAPGAEPDSFSFERERQPERES